MYERYEASRDTRIINKYVIPCITYCFSELAIILSKS